MISLRNFVVVVCFFVMGSSTSSGFQDHDAWLEGVVSEAELNWQTFQDWRSRYELGDSNVIDLQFWEEVSFSDSDNPSAIRRGIRTTVTIRDDEQFKVWEASCSGQQGGAICLTVSGGEIRIPSETASLQAASLVDNNQDGRCDELQYIDISFPLDHPLTTEELEPVIIRRNKDNEVWFSRIDELVNSIKRDNGFEERWENWQDE